jgi:hypothetical protein
MSTTKTAKEISEAWLTYVNDLFMTENGCNRARVVEEFKRLDASGKLMQAREDGRVETDELIEEILRTPAESRDKLYCTFDSRSLLLVNDRVQCGTELLIGFVQKGQQINTEGLASLEDFFRQILLQRPEA